MLFENIANIRDYWNRRVSPHLPVAEFRPDFPRPAVYLPDQGKIGFEIAGDQYERLMRVTGEGPFLIYTTLVTALMVCLSRRMDQRDIIIGSPMRSHPDIDIAKGPSNALPIVQEIAPQRSFRELLLAMRENLLEAYSMQEFSYNQLCENLGVTQPSNRCPLFDVALVSQDI